MKLTRLWVMLPIALLGSVFAPAALIEGQLLEGLFIVGVIVSLCAILVYSQTDRANRDKTVIP